jgi:hypothetical protein
VGLRVAAGLALVAGLAGCGTAEPGREPGTVAVTSTPAASPQAGNSTPPARRAMLPDPYQPLWPFTGMDQVRDWQQRHRTDGKEAWRLEAGGTALAFVRDFLGFAEIDQVLHSKVEGRDARVTVGYLSTETQRPAPAAVLHLLRVGEGPDAPWEVVGTDDLKTFTLTVPAYGAKVTSPVRTGGRIIGIDESIQVQVHQPSSPRPIGKHCCVAAGGASARWSAVVPFTPNGDPVLTIVATTGGHIAEVERFAITAVRR